MDVESTATEIPTRTVQKKYGVQCDSIDFGTLNARNQLITKAINPALDTLLAAPIYDHKIDSGTRYTIKILLISEYEEDLQ